MEVNDSMGLVCERYGNYEKHISDYCSAYECKVGNRMVTGHKHRFFRFFCAFSIIFNMELSSSLSRSSFSIVNKYRK